MNFKRFSTSDNQWHDIPYYQHKTATDTLTLPAVIYPNDTSVTVGIKGNTTQSGTPTPDNPVTPEGTGERTANLLDFYALQNAPSGTIGTSACNHVLELVLEANTAYTCISNGSGSTSGSADDNRSIYFNNSDATNVVYSGHSVTVTTGADGKVKIGFFSSRANAQQYINGTAQVWLVKGSAPLSYEPYGIKIPILSANTTTPVYLGQVQSTRQIEKLVLTGQESWVKGNYPPTGGYQFYTPKPSDIAAIPNWLTTHFRNGAVLNGSMVSSYLSLFPEASILPENATANDFKAWLAAQYAAGTPVCVWYVLATETTSIVNEPLMKIGEYADEVSGISIPTTAGANTLDVDTTVKPSEVTANFNGWHPVSSAHERSGGQWD